MAQDSLVSFTATSFTWEGANVLKMQIRRTRRARVTQCLRDLKNILADDNVPAAPSARFPKVKVLDNTLPTASTTSIVSQANNIIARLQAILVNI